ncbi:MAG: Maf family protein [Candidatus Thorarchaeota archaeon]
MSSLPEIILASQSPARAKVLGQIQLPFIAIPSKIDEKNSENRLKNPQKFVLKISQNKAKTVALQHQYDQKNCVIIGCDTLVVSPSGKIVGKPENRDKAGLMLRALSGKEHTVLTGCTIMIYPDKVKYQTVISTSVRFRILTTEEINYYLKEGEWQNKAGSYAIQGLGAILINEIDGDYYNIVGLPISWIWQTLWNHYGNKLLLIKEKRKI